MSWEERPHTEPQIGLDHDCPMVQWPDAGKRKNHRPGSSGLRIHDRPLRKMAYGDRSQGVSSTRRPGFRLDPKQSGPKIGHEKPRHGVCLLGKKDPFRLDENGFPYHQTSEDALTFLRQNKAKPFFLYYATWLVHTPIHTRSEKLLDKYCKKLGVEKPKDNRGWTLKGQRNPFYCAMVEELDYYMGKLFDYLSETEDPRWPGHKLAENTYAIFTSDNGGMEGHPGEIITDNYPLDKGKISLMEGGTRVPLVITGPGIPKGVESDVMVNGLGFLPDHSFSHRLPQTHKQKPGRFRFNRSSPQRPPQSEFGQGQARKDEGQHDLAFSQQPHSKAPFGWVVTNWSATTTISSTQTPMNSSSTISMNKKTENRSGWISRKRKTSLRPSRNLPGNLIKNCRTN